MRRAVLTPAAVAASAALLVLGAPTASQAYTEKELSVCWFNRTPHAVQDLEVVIDGPSYKTASLDAGDCVAWDVRPGQYLFTLEDIDESSDAVGESAKDCPKGTAITSRITITRMSESYKARGSGGSIKFNVKKDRRTSITAVLWCAAR